MALKSATRQSITLPSPLAKRVQAIAKRRHTSASRILVELVKTGLEHQERERREFFALVERMQNATDPKEKERLKEAVSRAAFGGPL